MTLATISKPYTFSNNTKAEAPQVNSNFDTLYTAYNSLIATVNAGSFDASDTFTVMSETTTLAQAVADIGSTPTTLVIDSHKSVTDNLTIPSTLKLMVLSGGSISVASGKVLTINSMDEIPVSMFGAISSASIQTAINSVKSGGVVNVGDAGAITLTDAILVTKPCTIKIGVATFTSNIATAQWLVKASNVAFIGGNKATAILTSSHATTGNIIQWGVLGETHLYNNLTVKNLTFNLPQITGLADPYRTKLAGVASIANNINALSYIKNYLLVENCVFNEGADQISLEQTYHATLRYNTSNFNNAAGNGRFVSVWNSDYYDYNHNTMIDLAGTAINFNETYHTGALNKSSDHGKISYNTIVGTMYEAIQTRGNHTNVSHNKILQAKGVGIAISEDGADSVHDNLIDNNIIQIIGGGVGETGIYLTTNTVSYPFNNNIASNNIEISGTGEYGMILAGGTGNKVNNNNLKKAAGATGTHDGIYVTGGGPALISNQVEGFTRNGIYLNGATDVKAMGNIVESNAQHGISLAGVTRAFVSGNYAASNTNWGIVQEGVGNTGVQVTADNRFYDNGDGESLPTLQVFTTTITPTYADNAAALLGGLVAGDTYKTATGVLMIVY